MQKSIKLTKFTDITIMTSYRRRQTHDLHRTSEICMEKTFLKARALSDQCEVS